MKPKPLVIPATALFMALTVHTQAAVLLGTAADFGVLAATTLTNTGITNVIGDIGVHPGTAITGFLGTVANDGPGTFTGSAHQGDATSQQAQADALTAFNGLNNLPMTTILLTELAGQTLTPGVYTLGTAGLTGNLTLNGSGEYVFRIGSTLTTASSSTVSLINGADAANVYWAVGSSATLGEGTDFAGTIIAFSSISLTAGANVDGRLIALNGAVTLINNMVIPEPSTESQLALLSIGFITRRRRSAR